MNDHVRLWTTDGGWFTLPPESYQIRQTIYREGYDDKDYYGDPVFVPVSSILAISFRSRATEEARKS